MEIIYEIPNLFRITLIREVQLYADAPHIRARRSTPFVINYRAPNADRVEHCELTDELFRLFLSATPENREIFATLIRFLPEQFRMSYEMGAHLVNAPKDLLKYCLPATEQPMGYADYWRDAWDADEEKPAHGVEVLVCVLAEDQRRRYYTQEFATRDEEDGVWYDRKKRPLSGVEYWKYKSQMPAVKTPQY